MKVWTILYECIHTNFIWMNYLRFTLLQLQDMYPWLWFRQLQHSWNAAHQNTISTSALEQFHNCVDHFHDLCGIFISVGVQVSISLPHQHALFHYYLSIQLFGLPNGYILPLLSQNILKLSRNLGDIWADTKHSSKCSAQYYKWRS